MLRFENCEAHRHLNDASLKCWALRDELGNRIENEYVVKIYLQHEQLMSTLKAVANEIRDGVRPISSDSYLPPEIADLVFNTLEEVEKT